MSVDSEGGVNVVLQRVFVSGVRRRAAALMLTGSVAHGIAPLAGAESLPTGFPGAGTMPRAD